MAEDRAYSGDPPVIAHTPDAQGYSNLRDVQATTGHKVASGTIIPRAKPDGRSQGFDEHKPLKVTLIDTTPDVAGPPVEIDMMQAESRIKQGEVIDADPFEAYVQLGANIVGAGGSDNNGVQRHPSPLPGYTVPQSNANGEQQQRRVAAAPLRVASQPAAKPIAAPVAPPMRGTGTPVRRGGSRVISPPRSPVTLGVLAPRAGRLPQGDLVAARNSYVAALGLPYLTVEPQDPEVSVIFDLGPAAGEFQTYFHEAIHARQALTLVFDTRRKATQYIPPASPERTFRVVVPSLNLDVQTAFIDQVANLGVLDVLILLIVPEVPEDHPTNVALQHVNPQEEMGFSP